MTLEDIICSHDDLVEPAKKTLNAVKLFKTAARIKDIILSK